MVQLRVEGKVGSGGISPAHGRRCPFSPQAVMDLTLISQRRPCLFNFSFLDPVVAYRV